MSATKFTGHRNEVALLFNIYRKMPHWVTEILVDGKKYIGSVCSVTWEKGEIINGIFHPYLERNYFESFEITPGNFIWIQLIDIRAPANDPTIQNIFKSLKEINRLTTDYIKINSHVPRQLLLTLKRSIFDFNVFHQHKNINRAELKLNRALTACLFLNEGEYYGLNKLNAEILAIVKEHANHAVSLIIL